jgi:putative DNA primase/helicase
LRPLNELGGGFHLRGGSSLGKTTALYVAGSVWGGGGDKGFIRSWRATWNGIESISPLHNDGFLCLDDLGQVLAQDAGRVAYQLANGQTTQRANRRGGARASEDFLLIFLSNGEISLAQHVRQGGQQVRGGQEIRMCDIPADAGKGLGLFENLNGAANAAELATELRSSALRFYGAPIRLFLSALISSEWRGRVEHWRRSFKHCVRELHGEVSSEASRAIARFSLVAAGGELASELGITGWAPGEASDAAVTCFNAWFKEKASSGPMDEAAAFHQVVELLERHGGSRFQDSQNKHEPIRDRLGFIGTHKATSEREFWILPEQFEREFCRNFDSKAVALELKRRGFLRTDSEGHNRFRVKVQIAALDGERPRVYAVPMRILTTDEDN